jgi:hypothetical protein
MIAHSVAAPSALSVPSSNGRARFVGRLGLSLGLAALVWCTSACRTASLGRAPLDADLTNDGSTEAQAVLLRRYRVAYDAGVIVRPDANLADVSAEAGEEIDEASAAAHTDEAHNYLGTSDAAEQALETAAVGFDRFAQSEGYLVAGGVPVVVGLAVGAVTGFVAAQDAADANEGFAVVSSAMGSGALIGTTLIVPAWLLYSYTVPLLSSRVAAPDYRRAVRLFDADLEARVKAAATAPGPDAPEAPDTTMPAPPVGEPPPAAVDESAPPTPAGPPGA